MKKKTKKVDVRERKALLALHSLTITQLAREIGRARSTVSTIINYYPRKRSKVIEEHVASRLGAKYENVWGGQTNQVNDRRL